MKTPYRFPDPWPARGVPNDRWALPPGTPFGQRLRTIRQARGYSQAALGGRAGLHQQAVQNLERGRNEPTLSTLQKLSEGLNVSVADLTGQKPIGDVDLLSDLLNALEKAAKVTAVLLEIAKEKSIDVVEDVS